jgi:hypothetical protein
LVATPLTIEWPLTGMLGSFLGSDLSSNSMNILVLPFVSYSLKPLEEAASEGDSLATNLDLDLLKYPKIASSILFFIADPVPSSFGIMEPIRLNIVLVCGSCLFVKVRLF